MNAINETCPPLEDIAAFLDGKLSERERARVVAHLADCESCYAVFSGAARFQLEEEEPAAVIPLRRRTSLRWALPLAAVLVLGLATIPLYLRYSRMPVMLSAELVDPAALKDVPTDWTDDKRGGPEDAPALDTGPSEVLLGANLVDLRLNLARDDREQALNVLSRINGIMGGLLFVKEPAAFYEKAHGDLYERKRTPEEVTEEAARVEAELTEIYSDTPYLPLGKWTEAGRLSALAGNTAFFEDRDNRRFPGWLLRNAAEDLDEDVVPTLKRIRGILEDSDPSELPHEDLAKQFKGILDHYQHEADAADAL